MPVWHGVLFGEVAAVSSKGRGAPVADAEFYPTPAWCTRRILEALPFVAKRRAVWLEPCAGDGAIVRVVQEMTPIGGYINGGDIRNLPSCVPHSWTVGGFETYESTQDVVITNPPFSLAPELIRHFLPRCDWLILLLRASFRLGEWRHNMPDEYKLPQRPEFLASEKCKGTGPYRVDGLAYPSSPGCGWSQKVPLTVDPTRVCPVCGGNVQRSTSDSSEYSWFVWTPERNRSAGLTRVLPDTSLEERREGR